MTSLFFIFAAIAGTATRKKATEAFGRQGIWAINVCGAFLLGLIAGLDNTLIMVFGTAGLGSLTTISGVAREIRSWSSDLRLKNAGYLMSMLVAGVLAAWLGLRWGL